MFNNVTSLIRPVLTNPNGDLNLEVGKLQEPQMDRCMNDSEEEAMKLFSPHEKNRQKMDYVGRSLEDEAGMTTKINEMVKCWEIGRTQLVYPGCTANSVRPKKELAFCRIFCSNAGLQRFLL